MPDARMSPVLYAPDPANHRRHYCAFISYRHADGAQEEGRWVEWLADRQPAQIMNSPRLPLAMRHEVCCD